MVCFGDTTENVVALTLDDGPHCRLTPVVLETLARHNARATFFLIGSRAAENGDVVEAIVEQRHELGNHTWRDEKSARLPTSQLSVSVADTHELLSSFAPVRLFRPGAGCVNRKVREAAAVYDYTTVLGSIYPHDVRVPWTRLIVKDVLNNIRPGAIVILHEGTRQRWRVIGVLDEVLAKLTCDGYRVTTVSELLAAHAARTVVT